MNRDYRLGLLAAIAIMAPGAVLAALGVSASIVTIVSAGGAVAAIITLNRRWYGQIIARIDAQATHVRSAVGVAASAGGIPAFWSEHAVTPEALMLIQHMIAGLKPARILELGSGLSTVLIANGLRGRGEGHILTFDHDARWAEQTAETIRREKLEGFAEVRTAPLVEIQAGGRRASWYDLSGLDEGARFDMVIVDGPPAWQGDALARLPALYELRRRLSATGVLLLDDAGRPGETTIARQWQRDFPDLHFRFVAVGRGLFVASVQASALDLLPEPA